MQILHNNEMEQTKRFSMKDISKIETIFFSNKFHVLHIFGCEFEYTGIFTCLSVDLNTVEVDFLKKIAKN
jgi:hypothetical protein